MEQKNAITLYESAAETIKTAILQGQYEALKGENRVQLAVYFGIGKYISLNSRNGVWVAKTEHSHPLGMVVSTHFRCGKGVKRGLKNGALPFNID